MYPGGACCQLVLLATLIIFPDACQLLVQAETVRLSSESMSKQLEAELANAKSAAAQAAAAHKAASASWQSELALQRTEVGDNDSLP